MEVRPATREDVAGVQRVGRAAWHAAHEPIVGAEAVDEGPGVYGLGNCYVHPDRWGEGVGSRLLDRTERTVRSDGGNRIRLAVMADNERAIGFYESGGYERVAEGYDERLDVRRCFYAKDL